MNKLDISKLLEEKDRITIDVVGDSITWGLNHCNDNETYMAQFAEMLAKRFANISVYRYDGILGGEFEPLKGFSEPVMVSKMNFGKRIDIIRNGISGNTVRRAINRSGDFTGILKNGECADVTFFMSGINDALKSDSIKYVDPDTFACDYEELLNDLSKRKNLKLL